MKTRPKFRNDRKYKYLIQNTSLQRIKKNLLLINNFEIKNVLFNAIIPITYLLLTNNFEIIIFYIFIQPLKIFLFKSNATRSFFLTVLIHYLIKM